MIIVSQDKDNIINFDNKSVYRCKDFEAKQVNYEELLREELRKK